MSFLAVTVPRSYGVEKLIPILNKMIDRSLLMVDKICPRGRVRIVVECIYIYYEKEV